MAPLEALAATNHFVRQVDARLHIRNRLISLMRRESSTVSGIVPTSYSGSNDEPKPSIVVGIVIGSVAGLVLLLWIMYLVINKDRSPVSFYEKCVIEPPRRKSHRSTSYNIRSHRTSLMTGVRSPSVKVVRNPMLEQKTTTTIKTVQAPTPPPPPPPSPPPPPPPPSLPSQLKRTGRVVVEERVERRVKRDVSRGESDEVIVITEHGPARRKKSIRRRDSRKDSGYRIVDSGTYGGSVGGRRARRSTRRR